METQVLQFHFVTPHHFVNSTSVAEVLTLMCTSGQKFFSFSVFCSNIFSTTKMDGLIQIFKK
jgi:hypothetical protein